MLRNKLLPALLCVGLGSAGGAQAASVSYYLNQSNENAVLPDYVNDYLKVTIDDHDAVNLVTFTVEILPALSSLGSGSSNFGIQKFGFNLLSGDTLTSPTWTLPVSWSVDAVPPPSPADGFGKFDVELSKDNQGNRLSPLVFSFVSSGSVGDFVDVSSGNAGQGNVYFEAHVAGFAIPSSAVTSAYFGGSELVTTPVPVPAPLVLLASALVPLLRWRKRQK